MPGWRTRVSQGCWCVVAKNRVILLLTWWKFLIPGGRCSYFHGTIAGGELMPLNQEGWQKTGNGKDTPHRFRDSWKTGARNGRDGENSAYDDKDCSKGIAAHHPLAMLLDSSGAYAVESGC